ncbi:MAG: hypothetical protein ACR2LH_10755 [Thermoleophilaceae bacterium]
MERPDLLWEGHASLRGHVAAHKGRGRDVRELQAGLRYLELRIGELLGKATPNGKGDVGLVVTNPSISTDERHRFRKMADHREYTVEAVRDGKISRGAVLRYIDEKTRPNGDQPERSGAVEVRRGDFRETLADIEPASVALILTDPPYPAEFLPLWSDLAEFVGRVLVPGGSLLAYSGQGNLPEVLTRLSEHLRYWWTLALTHGHGSQNLPGKFVTIGWKQSCGSSRSSAAIAVTLPIGSRVPRRESRCTSGRRAATN